MTWFSRNLKPLSQKSIKKEMKTLKIKSFSKDLKWIEIYDAVWLSTEEYKTRFKIKFNQQTKMEAHEDSDVEELTPEERMAKEEFDKVAAHKDGKFYSVTVEQLNSLFT